jgi:hypothetical protein
LDRHNQLANALVQLRVAILRGIYVIHAAL